jgi:beta-mannosidase
VGALTAAFEAGPPDLFLLDLRLMDTTGTIRASNRYTFSGTADLAPLLDVASAQVDVEVTRDDTGWSVRLGHAGGPAALGLVVTDDRPIAMPGWAEVADSGFDLLPGEERTVSVRWADAPSEGRRLVIGGWNVDPITVT